MSQLSERIEELKPNYVQLLRKRLEIQNSLSGSERRDALIEIHKEMMRDAFLANDLASEEEFERLWPHIFDDYCSEMARTNYSIIINSLHSEMNE